MTAVQKVAIAGSGVAGLAAAIQLAKAGVEVDVFEAKLELSALGSGISLQGNALRVFDALGAWDDIRDAGYAFDGLNLRAPGPDAPIVAQLPDVKAGGPDYPGHMGIPRADLATILHVTWNARLRSTVSIAQAADVGSICAGTRSDR